jgi:hypothetical protein
MGPAGDQDTVGATALTRVNNPVVGESQVSRRDGRIREPTNGHAARATRYSLASSRRIHTTE